MGVAGCGKSTVGKALANKFGWEFIEGDDLHSADNIEKMSRGEPLTDEDRRPWLTQIGEHFHKSSQDLVISCSALRRSYRQFIQQSAHAPVFYLHLHTDQSVIADRMAAREDHFMPASLLDSQYQTLELLDADENGQMIDIADSVEQVISNAIQVVLQQP